MEAHLAPEPSHHNADSSHFIPEDCLRKFVAFHVEFLM